ncbi:MAG: hypothetical protein Q7S79_00140 [bacterium]|nr:hypothetical protein [bacterium]
MIEEDLIKVLTDKAKLEEAKKKQDKEVVDVEVAAEIVSEYMEHRGELVQESPHPRAGKQSERQYFST